MRATIDPQEQQHFAQTAATWWQKDGPFAVLHRLNPVRLTFIQDQLLSHFKRPNIEGLTILDIGSGGGLVAEPLARLNAKITALESEPQTVSIAKAHSLEEGLSIDYVTGGIEDLKGVQFDCVLALEVVEHVSDVPAFLEQASSCLKPGGILMLSTLNRNLKSFFLGIVAAEYLLKWAPKGTHSYKKFLKPSEVANMLQKLGLSPVDAKGIAFNPLKNTWSLNNDLDINYIMSFQKP